MSKALGNRAERIALDYLKQQGLKLVCANYQCRLGEIDLIMYEANALIFIEVKYRSRSVFGGPQASITQAKQNKLIRTASHYLVSFKKYDKIACRFDVIFVYNIDKPKLEWIKNAFELPSE